jgi:hypothetical protein
VRRKLEAKLASCRLNKCRVIMPYLVYLYELRMRAMSEHIFRASSWFEDRPDTMVMRCGRSVVTVACAEMEVDGAAEGERMWTDEGSTEYTYIH